MVGRPASGCLSRRLADFSRCLDSAFLIDDHPRLQVLVEGLDPLDVLADHLLRRDLALLHCFDNLYGCPVHMCSPPLTLSCWPVIQSPSVSKKRTMLATSSGSPKRPR